MGNLMVSVSGIRGIVGESLNPDVIIKYVKAYADYIDGETIVLGRDSRRTGQYILNLVKSILVAKGYDVYDMGIVPTPTVLLNIEILKADGGIIITASHNPIEWNALKLASEKGMFLTSEEGAIFLDSLKNDHSKYVKYDKVGNVIKYKKGIQNHIKRILSLINLERIKKRKFNVVLDCVNGAGGVFTPKLLKEMNCNYTVINEEPNGEFPRNPEPRPENLSKLAEKVKKEKADIGFAHDPDVDRLAVVDEKGEPIGEELTLALAAWKFLMDNPNNKCVCNLSTSMIVEDIASKYDSGVIRTPVGEVNVASRMIEENAIIGGEGNGGVIIPELHYTRDAPAAIAVILDFLVVQNRPVSKIIQELPKYNIIKDKIKFNNKDKRQKYMKKFRKINFEEKPVNIDYQDGIRFEWKKSWIHIRPSGTEPIIRVIGESLDKNWLKNKIEYIKNYE